MPYSSVDPAPLSAIVDDVAAACLDREEFVGYSLCILFALT